MKRLLCVMMCAIMLTGCGKGEVVETTAESNETTANEEIAELAEEADATIENDDKHPVSYYQREYFIEGEHRVEYYDINEESATATYTKVIDRVKPGSAEEELAALYEEYCNTCDETGEKPLNNRVVITITYSDSGKNVYVYDKTGKAITCIRIDKNGYLIDWDEYEYDNLGNRTKHISRSVNGNIISRHEYEYDSLGNWKKNVTYNNDGDITYWKEYEYEYDSMGNKIKDLSYEIDGSVTVLYEYKYEYDSQGNAIKSTFYREDGSVWQECEYDSMGNKTKCIEYNDSGTIWFGYEYDEQGNKIKYTREDEHGEKDEYEYDSMGNKTKWITYNIDGSIHFWVEYEYNSMGNETKWITYNADGSIECCETCEYEYDDQGNITKRIYSKDGIVERWIEYSYEFHDITPQRLVYIGQNLSDYSIKALE